MFRIVNLQLLDTLGLERRPGYRYAYSEFDPKIEVIDKQAQDAHDKPDEERDIYDNTVLEFQHKVTLFNLLAETHRVPVFTSDQRQARAEFERLMRRAKFLERFAQAHAIPPVTDGDEWQPFLRAALQVAMRRSDSPAVAPLAAMFHAFRHGAAEPFNAELARGQAVLAERPVERAGGVLGFESFFNSFEPFYHCAVLYVLALVLGFVSWLGFSKMLNRIAFWLI
ncbi:MAG: hypothetical protein GY953_58045, partial [bacterium]|nr:hypothetical protein [bacterium]